MANINGTQINTSATIVEKAKANVTDIRNLILAYDTDGTVKVATAGTAPLLGIAIIEAGYNDVTGAESGKVNAGDDVDIQVSGIGYAIAGGSISKGDALTATTGGKAIAATAGSNCIGIALSDASSGAYVRVLIDRFQKNPA